MKKYTILIVISILTIGLIISGLLFFSDDQILIQSLESRTTLDKPVFNKIKFIKEKNRDIWMMNQSHFGLSAAQKKWERLAIIIDKTNQKVDFYQIEAGPLEWSEELINKQVQYRASCFICHNNGPRAIRPDYPNIKVSLANKLKIFLWNLRMKSYGQLSESYELKNRNKAMKTPFRQEAELDNQTLEVGVCLKCHNDVGYFARNKLKRQQAETIKFMVKNKLMPPLGYSISESEQTQINDFVNGF